MKRTSKKKLYMVLGAVGTLMVIWFVWFSYGLYKDRLATEERLHRVGTYHTVPTSGQEIIEFQGKTYERNPSVKSILFMGVDKAGEMEERVSGDGGQADSIFVIAYDVVEKTVCIMMIPRDTMTPITLTDLSGKVLGKDIQHLTLAYAYGDGKELSCERMSEAVSELLGGLPFDGYMAMNTSMIGKFNDLAGGVTVAIEVEGMKKRDPALEKGKTVTLTGKQAETFVRYRDINIDNSAIHRMEQQTKYIEAYIEAVRNQTAKDDQTIVRIMDAIEDDMITNMSKPQYMEMGMAVLNSKQSFTSGDILTIPGEAVVSKWFDEFHHYPDGTIQMVLDLFYRER